LDFFNAKDRELSSHILKKGPWKLHIANRTKKNGHHHLKQDDKRRKKTALFTEAAALFS
jgi:hypothetical protein